MKKLFLIFVVIFVAKLSQAQWEDDVNISQMPDSSFTSYCTSHSIAASSDTVHVVWYYTSEGNSEIYYQRSTDGGLNWEPNTRITDDEASSVYPGISLSGPDVHIVWQDKRDGNSEIYYKRSTDGGESWEEESRLTEDITSSYMPVIATSGSYVNVAWVNGEGTIWAQINHKCSIDGGITWEPEKILSVNSMIAYNPSIAVSGSDVYAFWNDRRDGDLDIYMRKSSDNGLTWGPEIRLTNDPYMSWMPSIASSGSNVYVVWTDNRDGNNEIYYKGSADGGETWGDDKRITNDPANSQYSNLALSNSVLHIVWQDDRKGVWNIYYSYSDDGGETWETDKKLNDVSLSSEHPFIAVSDPVLHVIWYDYRDFNYEIYYKQNPTGGVYTGIPTIETQTCIYPNPVSNQLLNIELPLANNAGIEVTLYSLAGKNIFQQSKYGITGTNVLNLKLPNISAGLYFLQIKYDNQVLNSKVVVQ